MAKSRDERFESASDLAFALESVGDSAPTSQSGISAAPAHAAKPRLSAWAVPALMLTVGVALGLLAMRALTPSDGGDAATLSRRFDLVLPDSLPMSFIGSAVIAIEQRSFTLSPKGDRLVYAADDHGVSRLVDMDLVSGTVQKMPGTDGAYAPSFSPDGHWVAFLTIGAVKKIEIGGAGPVALSDLDEPFGVQWQDNERLLTSERQGRILTRVRASGGRLDSLAKAPNAGYNPAITPDAKTLLWSSVRQARAMDIESGELSALTVNGREPVSQATFADLLHGQAPRLLASNQLLYTANGAGGLLMGVPVSPGKLKPLGEPVELASNLRICPNGSLAQYDAVPGLLVYASDPGSGFTHFVRRHPDGRVDSLALPSGEYNAFELSPDGTRIAALLWPPAGKQELWILDIARGTRERVGDATNIITWSADGRAIDYFVTPPISATSASLRLHLDGTGTVDTLVRSDTLARAISPDGHWALRTSLQAYGGYLGTGAGFARSGPVMPNLSSLGRFSPDSRWLATTFSEAGHSEIYVLPVDDPTRRLRVSVAGGEEPRWMPDGRHMVYRYGRDWFEASFDPPAAPGTPPTVGTPVKIFSGPYANLPGYEHSLFPDGSFLLLVDSGVDVTRRLHVITNVESLIRAGAAKAK
jgi:Tol biopolymer transport system component